jgi:hypothetical protein
LRKGGRGRKFRVLSVIDVYTGECLESFRGKLRDECLNASWSGNLFEARAKVAAWKEEYNEERPHSSFGYLALGEFARRISALRSPTGPCAPKFEELTEGKVMSSGEFGVV